MSRRGWLCLPLLALLACADELSPVASSGSYADLADKPDLSGFANTSDLAAVATSGAYADLKGAPRLDTFLEEDDLAVVAFTSSYTDLSDTPDLSVFAHVGSLAPVATTGQYSDLFGAPDLGVFATTATLAPVATSGAYSDLVGTPDLSGFASSSALAPVAVTGHYEDLEATPDLSVYAKSDALAEVAFSGSYADLSGAPTLAPVATSGSYDALTDKPDLSIYETSASLAPVARSGSYDALVGRPDLSVYATRASLAAVATSGSYTDLANKPNLGLYATSSSLVAVAFSGRYADLSGAPWRLEEGVIYGNERLSVVPGEAGVDQESLDQGGVDPSPEAWQSFTAGVDGTLTQLHLRLQNSSGAVETGYAIEILEGEGTTGASLGFAQNVTIPFAPSGSLAAVPVPHVRLTAGRKYTWKVTNPVPFGLVGNFWSTYTRGRSSLVDSYQPGTYPDADFAFRTWVEPDGVAVDENGRLGLGTSTPAVQLDVTGDAIRVQTPRSPASGSPCHAGEISWDVDAIYVCVATNHWKRAALADY